MFVFVTEDCSLSCQQMYFRKVNNTAILFQTALLKARFFIKQVTTDRRFSHIIRNLCAKQNLEKDWSRFSNYLHLRVSFVCRRFKSYASQYSSQYLSFWSNLLGLWRKRTESRKSQSPFWRKQCPRFQVACGCCTSVFLGLVWLLTSISAVLVVALSFVPFLLLLPRFTPPLLSLSLLLSIGTVLSLLRLLLSAATYLPTPVSLCLSPCHRVFWISCYIHHTLPVHVLPVCVTEVCKII